MGSIPTELLEAAGDRRMQGDQEIYWDCTAYGSACTRCTRYFFFFQRLERLSVAADYDY